tara:strand:+ start:2221 stop:2424 length:204 start_codon:yes stop_codon:yes gene_type:complete
MALMTDKKHAELFRHVQGRYGTLKDKHSVDMEIEHAIAQKTLGFEFSLYTMRGVLEEFGLKLKPLKK